MPALETFINIYSKILVNSFSLRSDRYKELQQIVRKGVDSLPPSRCKSNEMHSLGVT